MSFPVRGLIVFTAFSVVLGTLVIQRLTLTPLLRALDLRDDDPVGHEVSAARERALRAGLASFASDQSPSADAVRQALSEHLGYDPAGAGTGDSPEATQNTIRRVALQPARQEVHAMRASDEIGDDAFHRVGEELDWLEMSGTRTAE